MRKFIAIGMLGFALCADVAAAQTPTEQARILGDFQQGVVDYPQRHTCLSLLPGASNGATPAPKISTLPVALVFRQLIARALVGHVGEPAIFGVGIGHRAVVLEPFPLTADEIREWITHPVEMTAKTKATRKPLMKAYPNLPKEDLDALVAFLASKKKK